MPRSRTSTLALALSLLASQLACSGAQPGPPGPPAPPDAGAACVPEPAEALCEAAGKDCETIDATDQCGEQRSVDCGACPTGKVCRGNLCQLERHEAACADGLDEDADGLTDCADVDCAPASACAPRPKVPCARQRDCGDIVDEMVTDVCLSGTCQPPGPATYRGDALTAQVGLRLVFGGALTGQKRPRTAVVRFVDSRRPDGTALTCAALLALGNCQDQATRSRIDGDPAVNQVFRSVYALDFSSCAGTECVIPSLFATVPQGQGFLLYGEAWFGVRELNEPTGECASVSCVEGQVVDGGGGTFQVTFR